MNKKTRIALPVVVLAALASVAGMLIANPPEAKRRAAGRAPLVTVETRNLEPSNYQVVLDSYGTVQPRTQSRLVAQVGGQITWVSPSLQAGGYFETDEVLLKLDSRDYEADLAIAQANLIDAQRGLVEAEAQVEQARDDWKQLGRSGAPSELVLKIPQLKAAQARVRSAEATVEKAQLNLERTEVQAPFPGRVLAQQVDLGQVIAANTVLADIYAVDALEVRLPLRNRDLAFIELPESYRFEQDQEGSGRGDVLLESSLGGEAQWVADLVRTESAIDEGTQQLHVVAQVADPFGVNRQSDRPLKIGQYVTAKLAGRVLSNAIVIPNTSIYQGSYVYRVVDGLLKRTDITIAWQNNEESVVDSGLAAGDELVLTSLGQVASGTRVNVAEKAISSVEEPSADRPVGDGAPSSANSPAAPPAAGAAAAQVLTP